MEGFGHLNNNNNNIQNELYIEGQNNISNNYNYNNLGNYNYNNNDLNKKKKPSNIVEEAFIDKLENEENEDIGFDLSLLKRDKLYVNLIQFDSNITNIENYYYFCKFKVDVVGGYHALDDLEMLEKYLKAIENKFIPFIIISSGSSGKDVIKICKKYSFIKEVIIFCGNLEYNQHYLNEYPGYVNRVFNKIGDIYKYIKDFGENYKTATKKYKKHFIFSSEDIEMDRQLD